jgi:lipopolysaccharide export system protein LptC
MQADRYSQLVSLLKVLFPLMALAVLSTLFLLSRTIDTDAVIPFADTEIQERLRDQQITGPFFSGTSADGDMISFSAKTLITPLGSPGENMAEDIKAQIDMAGGTHVSVSANTATYNIADDKVALSGDVVLTTSTGYRITTARVLSEMSSLNVYAPGNVTATGPFGEFTSGGMQLETPQNATDAQLVFNNGVKLIYDPKQPQE